jgi:flagellar protein FliO/FliZ
MPKSLPAALAAACTLLLLDAADAFGAAAGTGENTPVNLGDGSATTNTKVPGSSAGGSIVRTVVGLAIVIAVIYGLYWVLKQVKASRETASSGSGLETVATIPLGPNRALHLVRAGRELMLLGVAEHTVVPIRAYREDEARALGLIDGVNGDGVFDADGPTQPPTPAAALRDMLVRLQQRTVRS